MEEKAYPSTGTNVRLTRMGGLAGLPAMWEVDIDHQPDAQAWRELLHQLPWDDVQPVVALPDRFSYVIRCSPHAVVLSEQQVRGPWRELIDRVLSVESPQRAADARTQARGVKDERID